MAKKVSELSTKEFGEWSELWNLERLLTKNVDVLKLNLPSRESMIREIQNEIKRIEER